jgi:ACS family glucarate transporter-like MFS transporter
MTEPPDQISDYRWVVMGVWLTASVSGFMVMATLGILLPAITEDLDLSPTQQGMLGSAAFWGNLALAIPLSWWTSRYGPKILTTVTLLLGTGFLFMQGWAPVFAVLLLGRVAFGITIIARQPARAFLMQQWFPQREVILVNSISNAMFGVVVGGGLAAAPFILGALGDDWRTTLNLFGGMFCVLTILWVAFGRERITSDFRRLAASQDTNVLTGTLRHRDLWVGGLGFIGATTTWSAFLSFFPTMMLNDHEVSLRWSGSILALGIFMGGVSGLGFGWLVTRTRKGNPILLALGALMAVSFAGMTFSGSIPLLLVLTFINGIAWGFWPILYSVPFHLPGIRPRELAMGIAFIMMMSSVGTTLGPLLTGLLQEATGDLRLSLFIVSVGPFSVSAAGMFLKHSSAPRPEPVAAPTQTSDD